MTRIRHTTTLAAAALAACSTTVLAQPRGGPVGGDYAIAWSTLDAGGGASAGGAYTLRGTIAQPDAATPAVADTLAIAPGFWPGVPFLFGCNPADTAPPFGELDFSDVFDFLVAFGAMDPAADLALPTGVFDFSDVFAFLVAFGEGCP